MTFTGTDIIWVQGVCAFWMFCFQGSRHTKQKKMIIFKIDALPGIQFQTLNSASSTGFPVKQKSLNLHYTIACRVNKDLYLIRVINTVLGLANG